MHTQSTLRELIHTFKMTQQQIADEVGVSQPTISALYNGLRKSTSFETGQAIEKIYESKVKKVGRRARGPRQPRQQPRRS